MNANSTRYQHSSNILGSFEFTGTQSEWEAMIAELRSNAPEFDGEMSSGVTRDTLPGQARGQYRDCLTYNGECIAIAIGE